MKATAKLYHDTRRPLKDSDKYPVKVAVIYQRKTKLFSTGHAFSIEEFTRLGNSKYLTTELRTAQRVLNLVLSQFQQAIEQTVPFTIERLTNNLNPAKNAGAMDLLQVCNEKIAQLKDLGKVSTSKSYKSMLNRLQKFANRKKLDFADIDSEFLKFWEKDIMDSGCSIGAVGVYMRNLRHIYNLGIDKKLVDPQLYPFGRKKYVIKAPARTKKALSNEQLALVVDYWKKAERSEKKALDFWMFSLTSNGINMRDILEIKWKQVDKKTISIRRSKTRGSNSRQQEITVYLNPINLEIIKRQSTSYADMAKNDYVFPDFTIEMTDERKYNRTLDRRKLCNKYLNDIGETLKLPIKLSFETARHTFANTMKYKNVSMSVLSGYLGHSSTNTTDYYLGTIATAEENQIIQDFVEGL